MSDTVLTFLDPPPGLAPLDRFTLAAVEGSAELYTLRSIEAPDTRLFLLDPAPFFPDYRPRPDAETLERLAVTQPDVLVVVHPATGDAPHTANLLAPVLINPKTGAAVQTVLDDAEWPLRAPLVAPAA